MRNVVKDYPDIKRKQVEHVRDLMGAHIRDCLVTDYDDLIEPLELPDPDDRHVLAAAIRCGASVIVTRNLKDFPAETSKSTPAKNHLTNKKPTQTLFGVSR